MNNNILETGILMNAAEKKEYPFEMKILGNEHLDQVLEIEYYVLDRLDDKDLCLHSTLEIAKATLNGQGLAVGTFVNNELIGIRTLYYPPADSYDNLGNYTRFDIDKTAVTNMERTFVRADYRGNSLQRRMSEHVLKVAAEQGKIKHVCSMVSPKNGPSISEKFALGLCAVNLVCVYGGHWRYIFHKDITQERVLIPETVIPVLSIDLEKQTELVNQGYYGFKIKKEEGNTYTLWGKFK